MTTNNITTKRFVIRKTLINTNTIIIYFFTILKITMVKKEKYYSKSL